MFRYKHDLAQINKLLHDVFVGEMKLDEAPQITETEYRNNQFYDQFSRDPHPVVKLSTKYRDALAKYVEESLKEAKDPAAFDQAKNPALLLYLIVYCGFKLKANSGFGDSLDTIVSILSAAEKNSDIFTLAYLKMMTAVVGDTDEAKESRRAFEREMRAIALKKIQEKITLASDEAAILQSALDKLELYDLTALAEGYTTDKAILEILNHIAIEKNNEALARKLVASFELTDQQSIFIFCHMCNIQFKGRANKEAVDIEAISRLAKYCMPKSEIAQAKMLQWIINQFNFRFSDTGNLAVRQALMDDLFHILNVLVSNNVNINAKDAEGNTFINHCCQLYNHHLVDTLKLDGVKRFFDFLVSKGADPTIANHKGDTPLHSAATNFTSDLVAMMLEEVKGIKADVKNAEGHTPMVAAALICMENPDEDVYRDFTQTLRRFLVNRKDPNKEERNKVLLMAVEKGDAEMVKIMLDHGADYAIKTKDKKSMLALAKTLFTPEEKKESEVKTAVEAPPTWADFKMIGAPPEPEAKDLSLDAPATSQPKESKAQVISAARYAALITQLERDENPDINIWNLRFGPMTAAKAHATGTMPDLLKKLKGFAGPMGVMAALTGTVAQERSPLIARGIDFKKPVEEKDVDHIFQILDPKKEQADLNKAEFYNKYKDHEGVFAFLCSGVGNMIKAKMTEAIDMIKNPDLSKEDRAKLIEDYKILLTCLLKGADASDKLWLKAHLAAAVNEQNKYLVEILLQAEVDPNARHDYMPIINLAIERRNPDIVRLLLREEKLDLTATDAEGINAFMQAAKQEHEVDDLVAETILLMVMQKCKEKRVPFTLQTPDGRTALHLAAWRCSPVVMKTLIDFAKKETGDVLGIHMRDDYFKQRVLHYLWERHDSEREKGVRPYYTELLLAMGAQMDINAQDSNGDTSLMIALRRNCKDAALVLLAHGADPRIQNIYDEDAFTVPYDKNADLQPALEKALQQARSRFEEADKRSAQAAIQMPSVYTAPPKQTTQQTEITRLGADVKRGPE